MSLFPWLAGLQSVLLVVAPGGRGAARASGWLGHSLNDPDEFSA